MAIDLEACTPLMSTLTIELPPITLRSTYMAQFRGYSSVSDSAVTMMHLSPLPSSMDVRKIILDFGGTVVRSRADLLPFFQAAAKRAGTTLLWEAFLAANEESWEELWPTATALLGKIPSFADLVREKALRKVGAVESVEQLVQYIREEALSPRWSQPFPETESTLRQLRERGYRFHLLSNNVDYLPILLRNLGWGGMFESVTYS